MHGTFRLPPGRDLRARVVAGVESPELGNRRDVYVWLPGAYATEPDRRFPVLYLQAGVAGGIMILGALGIYIFAGFKKSSVEFLIATDGEMKKVNWTTYREVKGSTIVVIVATFLIAGFLFVVDLAFSNFFSWIDVLQK